MKFRCEKTALVEAVSTVGRAVATKSMHPSLEGIFMRANNNSLFLAGYDLELGITTNIDADIDQPGSIVISSKLFSDIVRKLPGDDVEISVDEKLNVYIKSGKSEFSISGLSSAEYPELPQIEEGTSVLLPQNVFATMIRQTIFAVAQTETRPAHKGVLFELEEGSIRMVAVDGSRMAIRNEKIENSETISFNIPGKSLNAVQLILKDDDSKVNLAIGQRHAIMEINGYAVITRLLEGEFLQYRKAISDNNKSTVRVKTRDMIDAVERASLIINDYVKSPLICNFKDERVFVSCNTSMGSVNDEFPVSLVGDEVEIGFSSKFLQDALRHTECDEILLQLDGPLAPMKILPTDGDDFLFLVLPVRLKRDF